MQVNDSFGYIFEFFLGIIFLKCFIDFEMGEEGPFFHVFQNKVDILSIIKETIKFQDVIMITEYLDSYFQQKLVYHEVRFYNFFVYLL